MSLLQHSRYRQMQINYETRIKLKLLIRIHNTARYLRTLANDNDEHEELPILYFKISLGVILCELLLLYCFILIGLLRALIYNLIGKY